MSISVLVWFVSALILRWPHYLKALIHLGSNVPISRDCGHLPEP